MKPIRVLVIDDSAFARKVILEVLSKDPEIDVVGTARDGLDGLEKINELSPDVVTLDLIMPELDGIGLLKALKDRPSPKIIVVSVSGSETEIAIEALALGAIDIVAKPTAVATERLYELSSELVTKVKIAAKARPIPIIGPAVAAPAPVPTSLAATDAKLLVIGTSTGGPQALTELFKTLPANFPVPIAVALHIPAGYTAPLAARISGQSAIQMVEATDGAELVSGMAFLAPGGRHLTVETRGDGKLFAKISFEPVQTLHHPSVDVLFASAARATGAGTIGLVLTGMGNDGTAGAGEIKNAGGRILAESESSCVVYGMPRAVTEAGFTKAQAPLAEMSALLVHTLNEVNR